MKNPIMVSTSRQQEKSLLARKDEGITIPSKRWGRFLNEHGGERARRDLSQAAIKENPFKPTSFNAIEMKLRGEEREEQS